MEEIDIKRLNWHGRFLDNENIRYFDYSASGFSFVFRGKKAEAVFVSDADSWEDNQKAVLGVYVCDGHEDSIENIPEKLSRRVVLSENETRVTLFESDTEKSVCIYVMKLSECKYGYAGLKNLNVNGYVINSLGNGITREDKKLKIEAIGDSITCGYGIEGFNGGEFSTSEERPDKSFAFYAAKKLGAELQCCSWSGIGLTSHYIDSEINIPDTDLLMGSLWPYTDKFLSKRLGLEPEVWNESKFSPDIILINLGTNDASFVRNREDRRLLFVAAYRQFLECVHRRSPFAKIICCYGMMEQNLMNSVREAVDLFANDFPKAKISFLSLPLQLESDGMGTAGHPSELSHKKAGEIIINKK